MKVLIVGHGKSERQAVLGALAQNDSGLEALEANTCKDALALAESRGRPDLVLLDVHAAGSSGMHDLQVFCLRVGTVVAALPAPLDTDHASELGLTHRQSQVLCLLAQGKSNKQICRELNLAEGTIKIHVTGIFKALGVANRTQAALEAARLGISTQRAR